MKTKNLVRNCVVCGKRIFVIVNQDKTYKGGHFFGKLHIGKRKKAEYWECNRCFTNPKDTKGEDKNITTI